MATDIGLFATETARKNLFVDEAGGESGIRTLDTLRNWKPPLNGEGCMRRQSGWYEQLYGAETTSDRKAGQE
jgi:hypothetical protein